MKNALRRRFWLETAIASVTCILCVITLIQRDWIELVFGIDPDNHNGALEWLIIGTLLAATIALSALASYEWRRARAAIS
jgi:hypothetical protein